MPSAEAAPSQDQLLRPLLDVARDSIAHGLREGVALAVDATQFAPALRAAGASFVTLHVSGELRGCTGSLGAVRPLVADVARHAYEAAFLDARFPPIRAQELSRLHVHVSILGNLESVPARTEDELLSQLTVGVDGLVLEEGPFRATFLPAVWAKIPSPAAFVCELKRKAGLPPEHWSSALRFSRYRVTDVED